MNPTRSLTYRHVLQRADHQAVVDVPPHPLSQARVLLPPRSGVGEGLGESEAADGGGVDHHGPPGEPRPLQDLQHLQAVVEPPPRPQEVHDVALDQEDVHAAVQVEVPVLAHRRPPGAEPGEEEQEGPRGGRGVRWVSGGGGGCA